jgi:hypothetical protein
MKRKKYLDSSRPFPVIKFPERVVPKTFEDILSETYKKTLLKKTKEVEFDFSRVVWCDIFELSLISVWILELLTNGARITFRFPSDKRCYQFLITYRFDYFLTAHDIKKENASASKETPAPTDLIRAPFFPLSFFDEAGLVDLLEDLNYGNRLQVLLDDVKEAEIVRTGVIRDVILKELIDNVIIHGDVRFAYLIMTKLGAASIESAPNWTKRLIENVTPIERPFFQALKGKPFLALVIGDKGDGITKTLQKRYLEDTIIHGVRSASDDLVLTYSFLYHSTRRTLEERLGEIQNVISEEAKKYPPPTGLFRLKEKVRDFRGLLYARSGTSIIAYDFYNNPDAQRPILASSFKPHQSVDFGGTQFKLYFPIELPRKTFSYKALETRTHSNDELKYFCIFMSNYSSEGLSTSEKEASQLFFILQELDRIAYANKDKLISIILDFSGEINLSAKAIHYLLFESMQRQTSTLSIIAINIDTDRSQWQAVFDHRIPTGQEKRPLLLFDVRFEPHFFGLGSDAADVLEELAIEKPDLLNEGWSVWARKYNHIFDYDLDRGEYQPRHSRARVVEAAREFTRAELEQLLQLSTANIFHVDAKVLLPSRKYCKGFFEIHKLTTKRMTRAFLKAWYKYWLLELKPDFIISISHHIGTLIDEAIVSAKDIDGRSIQHINLRTPINELELVRLSLRIEPKKMGLVVIEVIGSGDTIHRVLEKVQATTVSAVIAVVNSNESGESQLEFKGRAYSIRSILTYPLHYYPFLPPGWRYSEILQVDPSTHLLLPAPAKLEGPLWKGIDVVPTAEAEEINEIYANRFLDDCVVPTDSFLEGHFTNGDKHILYLFNIPSLVGYFSEEIADVITKHIELIVKGMNPSPEITHVLYLSRNPGVRILARLVSSRFEKSKPLSLRSSEDQIDFGPDYSTEPMDAVIVIDDAIVSGESMFQMYDIAEQRNAQHILAYVLIKRGPDSLARRFEKVSEYGHSKIQARYLADVELPIYSAESCPVCDRLIEFEELRIQFPDFGPYSDFLNEESNKLSSVSVRAVESQEIGSGSIRKGTQSLVFRWKLELARRKSGMAPRKELDSITKNYAENPTAALCLFKVIAKEQKVFLRDEQTRKTVFYDTFAGDIVSACRHFLESIETLTDDEFEAVICLILFLDETFRVDELLEILRKALNAHGKFFTLVTQMFSTRLAYDHPGRTAKVFRALSEEVPPDSGLSQFISQLLRYWLKEEADFRAIQNDRLAWFKELTGRLLHETGHLKDTIIGYLSREQDNYEAINKSWVEYHEYLSTAMPLLRNFSENHVSAWLTQKLDSNVTDIEVQIAEANKLVAFLAESSETKTKPELSEVRDLLRQHVLRIFNLVSGPGGTHALLENFKTNVKSVAFQVVQQQAEDLKSSRVEAIRDFPEESCVVFGEDTFIIQIFQNLIENVWKNANASKLRIKSVPNGDDNERVDILFLDDGRGLDTAFTYDDGLEVVKRNASASCGEFDIRNVLETDDWYSEGFRTVAILTLPRLRERTHEHNHTY